MANDDRQPSRRFPHAVTLTEVAREAGVGQSTASRALRNQGSVSARTRQKVAAAVAKLGYVPNRIAGTLASTRSQLVGVVVPSLANIVFPDLLRGIGTVLDDRGFRAVIGVTEYDRGREESLIESMLTWRPAALIVVGLEHSPRAQLMLRNSGIRVAEVFDTDGAGIDIVVGFSNCEAGRASARHLLSRGYRKIAYIGHDLDVDPRAAKRFRGFRQVLSESGVGLADQEVFAQPSSVAVGREGLVRLLDRHPDLDAVYLSNDDMAMGAYFLCVERGLAVPGRLALMGFNGLEVGRFAPQPLTTLLTPRVSIGEAAARLVCADGPPAVVDLGFQLIKGATS